MGSVETSDAYRSAHTFRSDAEQALIVRRG
jgi:hypothetical protein